MGKDMEYYQSIGYEIVLLAEKEVCSTCQGEGKVRRKLCKKTWGLRASDYKRCPECKGKGL
jgi:DnaJ-class molecular chaperone